MMVRLVRIMPKTQIPKEYPMFVVMERKYVQEY